VAERYLLADAMPASKRVSGSIALTELTSINENIGAITGRNVLGVLIARLAPTEASETPGRKWRRGPLLNKREPRPMQLRSCYGGQAGNDRRLLGISPSAWVFRYRCPHGVLWTKTLTG
jgi:hypothetical protein